MDHLSPHKTFKDLQDIRDLPGVSRHRPIPRRAKPLPGTKTMLHPKDGHLPDLIAPRVPRAEPVRTGPAMLLGWVAVGCSGALTTQFWSTSMLHKTAVEFLLFAVIHVCGMFAGILSKGRVRIGYWAIGGLYAAYFTSMLINHLCRR